MKTKYYTGKGDKGIVKVGKKKIDKGDKLFDVLGGIDDLNAWIGLCRSSYTNTSRILRKIQDHLFIAQAQVAAEGFEMKSNIRIKARHTKYLENQIKILDKTLPKLEQFVIPGGTELATRLEVARTKTRSLEREIVRYSKNNSLIQYFNRLSSLFFVLSRHENYLHDVKEEHPRYK